MKRLKQGSCWLPRPSLLQIFSAKITKDSGSPKFRSARVITVNNLINAHSQINRSYLITPPPPFYAVKFVLNAPL